MSVFSIKAGTTAPDLAASLTRADSAVDLSDAESVTLRMTHSRTLKTLSAAMTVATASEGYVTYGWAAGDTDDKGLYRVDVLVDWGDGETEAFPPDGYETLEVT